MICGHQQKEKILGWIQMNVYFVFVALSIQGCQSILKTLLN